MIEENLYVFKTKNFNKHQKKLIDKIFKIPLNPLNMDDGETLKHTDWNLPKRMQREYLEYFNKEIFPDYAKSFCEKTSCKNFVLTKIWFQIYGKGDSHNEHNHPSCHFTNVFYVKLPNINLKTKITCLSKKVIETNISEGDIISFPSYYFHSSPKNTNDEDKIIIAFNLDILK